MDTRRWSEQHEVSSDNCDYKRDCRLSTLMEWMQRAGDSHLAAHQVSMDELVSSGMAWMLLTVDLELMRTPKYGDVLQLDTWHKGAKGVQWLRDYVAYDAERQLVAQSRTTWALVDLNKRRILRASAFPYDVPVNDKDSVGDMPEKVVMPDETHLELSYTLHVRQSSIDMNGHLNNARFADICLDAMTQEELERGVSRFRITYHKEIILGDQVDVYRSTAETLHAEDSRCFIRGQASDGSTLFDAEVIYREG
ncbi:thioesterase [Paenibacillus alvei]|uniref:Thioesterase n=1 Tax=Paenibacillus alvei TaxID=44250 RepID=A0AAP6ZTK4_PAEAL|nr:acyl-ACP thioesterase domain-containing protein [Paenibacillus alvei]MBG9734837.1 acyl-ACP thioesterase [Paenibacillus alvei]MBG9744712.1 acyl-ACP thioesterase [Paenibacillus alvei]MCY9578867.1 thioesterase [Paenibacillus alvei]MCY9583923.1 thioesterase [Paenibacillus alvei]MCY9762958.1 thioesterase [Paenibacillus alvei]